MSNVSLIALGLADVREGTEVTAGGVAKMAEGIIQSWRSPIRWSYGKGDNEVADISCIGDMFKERRGPDGAVDSKFLPAMYRAVAECFLTGEDEFTSADKMQFKRAWQIAAGHFAGVEVSFVDTGIIRNGKRAMVRAVEVPASVAFDLYGDDGTTPTAAGKVLEADVKRSLKRSKKKADETAVRQMAEETPIECVGGKIDGIAVPSVSVISDRLAAYAVDAGLMPPKSSRASRVPAQKFVESVEFVTKCINDLITNDESEFAPSDHLDDKLRALSYAIDKLVN
jgi:hypothetical protein